MKQNVTPGMVSVLVPAYNAEAYLAETIESVLEQDWEPLELLVVDNGSTDRTFAVAESFGRRVRIISRIVMANLAPPATAASRPRKASSCCIWMPMIC